MKCKMFRVLVLGTEDREEIGPSAREHASDCEECFAYLKAMKPGTALMLADVDEEMVRRN